MPCTDNLFQYVRIYIFEYILWGSAFFCQPGAVYQAVGSDIYSGDPESEIAGIAVPSMRGAVYLSLICKQVHAYIIRKEIIMEITGAELFVKALKEENVETLFAYPGDQSDL